MERITKAKCVDCGKITAIRQPWGEGTIFLPRQHKVNGALCPGSWREAILVDFIDGEIAHTGIPETCQHPNCVSLFQKPKVEK